MKQSINKIFIGLSFAFILALIPYIEVNAILLAIPTDSTGGGGSGTGTSPSMQISLTADLDKSSYSVGEPMTVITSATMTVSGGGNTNVTITGNIVDSTSSPTTILYLNTNSGNTLYGSAVFTAPSVAGDYILRVDAGVLGTTGRDAQTQKMATKDIPFTVTSYANNGATVEVWSIPSSGVKNDPVDVGSKTTIHWLASGLGQGASCSSPQNPNVILNYPSGSFDTGVINSATNYTVTCKDKDGNTTTNAITPATQFAAKQGAEAVSINPSALGNGDQISDWDGTWYHLPFQTQTDFKAIRQGATIILGSNNIKIETLGGFPHDVISAKNDDVPGKVWTVQEDGTYKIDISANGKMTVTIGNRGGFIAAANFYLIINGVKYPISADNGGDACSSTFKYPVQYSITNLKNCDPTIQDQHTSFGKEVPLDFNFTKTVALKAGDTVEIKGLVTGWGFNSSILRDLWQSVSFYLNTNYTNFTITKEAVTTAGVTPANQISGTTTVAVKGIVADMPDLVASSPTPTSTVIGAEINFASVIKNQGTASTFSSGAAINFYNIFQLATKPNGGGTIEIFPSRRPMPALDAGETGIAQAQPNHINELGTHSVRACADHNTDGVTLSPDTRVDESDENNNCSAWVDVTVSGAISVNLSASPVGPLTAPGATNLSWTTTDTPDFCEAAGAEWSGANIANGDPVTHRSGMPAGTYIFKIVCHKEGQADATDSVTVVVNPSNNGVDSCGPGSGTTPQLTEPIGTDACAVGTLNSSSPADTSLAWNWSCGTVKTCSAPKSGITVPTGTISATDCTINPGKSSCDTTLKWQTVNPVGISEVTTPTNISVSKANSNTVGKTYTVSHGSRNFYLYNSGKASGELDMATANAVCNSNSPWDDASQTCKLGSITGMTGTITAGDCPIPVDKNTCTIKYNWEVLNPEVVGGTKISLEFGPDNSQPLYNKDIGLPAGANYTYGLYHGQATFLLTNNNKTVATKLVKSECDATSVWSDTVSKCVFNGTGTTGTLTGFDCKMNENESNCKTDLELNIKNPVSGAATNITKSVPAPNTVVATGITPTTKPSIVVSYPSTTFFLNHDTKTLNGSGLKLTASCDPIPHLVWDGTKCVKNIVDICDYAQPPLGCSYVNGPNYDSVTQCGKVLSCPPGITVSITATPASTVLAPLTAPGATKISWTTTGNPTSCDATSSSWSGSDIKNGDPVTQRSGMPAGNYAFGITCHKAGVMDAIDTVVVYVKNSGTWSYPACPTACGTTSSTQTQTCTGGNNLCSGTAATRTCAATAVCPPISVSISATPAGPLTVPGATNLTWTTTGNPTSCDATSASWSGSDIKNGDPVTQRSGMPAGNYAFGITCHKAGLADVTSSVTVVVNPVTCTNGATNPPLCNDNCEAPTTQNVTVACDKNTNGDSATSGSVTRSQIKSAFPGCLFPALPVTNENSKYESDDCIYPGGGGDKDLCPEPGIQTTLPCPSGDYCPNVPGIQTSLPCPSAYPDWGNPVCGACVDKFQTCTKICNNPPPLPNGQLCSGGDGMTYTYTQSCGGIVKVLDPHLTPIPDKIFKGRSSVLTWTTINTGVSCIAVNGKDTNGQDYGNFNTKGRANSDPADPEVVNPQKTTTYKISCTKGVGADAIIETNEATIKVDTIVIKET